MAMHGFSCHSGSGGGGGSGPVNYMIDENYYDKEVAAWALRNPLPKVIEGSPHLMKQMIDALDHKHKYTSGVVSFTKDDTDKIKSAGLESSIADITHRLKEMLFAGISQEHQHILIVAHTHLDRLELHYVLPRHNYEIDRAWNPAPPGDGKYRQMDAFTDLINVKYGLDDPRDPVRAKVTKEPEWAPADNKATRQTLDAFFKQAVVDGAIDNREELINLTKKAGFEITRVGKDYLSIKAPGAEKAIRLKGEIYNERFTSTSELANTKSKSAERKSYLAKPEVARRYKAALNERQSFIEKRFGKALGVLRNSEDYKSLRNINGAKHGEILEVSKIDRCRSNITNDNPNRNSNKNGGLNDSFGRHIDQIITAAERTIGITKHRTIATNLCFRDSTEIVKQGASILKSANPSIETLVSKAIYASVPSAPIAALGFGGDSVDSGDPEADRVLRIKRMEGNEINQKNVARANREAVASRKSFDLEH
ncbi:relaxase/mobilization nuclease domain-containing protein [Pseudomonas syringae]|uniref:relaxase/mobilization nuclease domain-containing protein n=1 Tax=Pseudomonas syringae TaxID=317 RepID=UPI000A215499|nr:relaxase/mobilization nuclease domain-containing protein [Pseudomonas syringae]AYL17492.1 hypothetical protein D9N00_25535 [Pseudomonas syringae pv. actinidiae]OSR52033.1 DNA relaxase MbeA [Pseudomonas syringae pv. actinidiae]OSR68989.1 DNA relaxase MbeA [Pseudomonas syringae pv. actinidiae]